MRLHLCILALACASGLAQAKNSDPSELGQSLTPMGSERAGNADGSIPAWTGGLARDAGSIDASGGYADPFAGEQPLYSVTPENLAQYQHYLSPGQIALFKRFPGYRMPVYPSHRSANLPQSILDQSRANASKTRLTDGGNGLHDYVRGIPFPLPTEGLEVIWNHLTRWRGGSFERNSSAALVRENGTSSFIRVQSLVNYAESLADLEADSNLLFLFKSRVLAPARLAAGRQAGAADPLQQLPPGRPHAEIRRDHPAEPHQPGPGALREAPRLGG